MKESLCFLDKEMLKIVEFYESELRFRIETKEIDFDQHVKNRNEALAHIKFMLPKMKDFITNKEYDKFYRWLGFVQGVLFSFGEFTINDLRKHNK